MSRALLLVRHGATAWSEEHRMTSRTDLPLTERGVAQAEALGRALAPIAVEEVWSSPLLRARQTADIVARTAGGPVRVTDVLREVDLGPLEGRTAEEAARAPEALLYQQWAQPTVPRAPGSESLSEIEHRARGVLDWPAWSGVRLAVSHGFFVRALCCAALGMPVANLRRLRLDPGHVVVLLWPDPLGAPRLVALNVTAEDAAVAGLAERWPAVPPSSRDLARSA